jgi:hypothetical protein
MKIAVKLSMALFAVAVCANVSAQNAYQARIAKSGGLIVKKGTFTGKVSIVNQQSRLPQNDCNEVAKILAEATQCNIVADNGDGAAIKLYIIDEPKEPTVLLATEDHWGKLNVSKLVDDLPGANAKKKFFSARARKMIIKSLSILMGGGSSQFPGNIMNAATVRELDLVKETIPVDMVEFYVTYLKSLGVTPAEMTTYRKACREGWAPAPTNDIQKAIWERVKADKERGPTNPIKIPMPKRK